MNKDSAEEKFALIHKHWRPKVVAQLNGQEVKLARFSGVFPGTSTSTRTKCFWSGAAR